MSWESTWYDGLRLRLIADHATKYGYKDTWGFLCDRFDDGMRRSGGYGCTIASKLTNYGLTQTQVEEILIQVAGYSFKDAVDLAGYL